MPAIPASRDGSPLRNRSLCGLTVTQFLGAFNDNLFKQIILLLAARVLFPGEDQQGIAFAVFAAPFVLFSGIAGNISERCSKRGVIVAMKVAEIAVMALAAWALLTGSWQFILLTLFLMGTQSAFFGPSKYGIVPEIVARQGLLTANGVIMMTTFLAILAGQALAGPLLDRFLDTIWVASLVCIALAALGTWTSLWIERTPPTRPDSRVGCNPFGGLWSTIRTLRRETSVWPVILVNSLFWFNGGVVQQAVTGMGEPRLLALGERENWRLSALLSVLAVALIVGCLLVPAAGRRVPRPTLVRAGALAMLVGQCGLCAVGVLVGPAAGLWLAAGCLALAGLGGAAFAVPLVTHIQGAPREGMKGKAFAVNNFVNFTFVFLAGGFYLAATTLAVLPTVAAACSGALLAVVVVVPARRVIGEIDGAPRAA